MNNFLQETQKYPPEKVKDIILASFQKKSARQIAEKTDVALVIVRDWLQLKHVCLYFLLMSEELFSLDTLIERISLLSSYVVT
ncbi:hypothetical protein [Candidatus Phytoplasma phoenicium]|uniref:Uncharacterized protein n=1 Tax=Candidatus Phytoplasma phoenicium TaxID=198422 RepID=A0A0L0MKB6_9MOLU|nr:hypothetical protein [Candidatus Phytoplasma phoenicium]KND62730.1 hypothetical protein AlmWB_00760 [Candidatus Phytoplasma phoenicium]